MQNMEFVEKAFIGSIMADNKLLNDTAIRPDHLTSQLHKTIYEKMLEQHKKGFAVDAISLTTSIEPQSIEQVGGISYLTDMQGMASEEHFQQHEKAILEVYRKRKFKSILSQALSNDETPEEVLSKLYALETHNDNDRVTASELAAEMFELPFKEVAQERAVTTGLQNLDNIVGGLRKTDLYILAGRPSIGKTALALNIAINAERAGAKVIFFSLEMGRRGIGYRLASHIGGLNLNKFKKPMQLFAPEDIKAWPAITGEISNMDFVIYEKPAQTIAEIRSKIRKELRESPGKDAVVLIDYLQLIQPTDKKATPNVQISQISRDLKQIAKEFHVPVVCLSQLNRAVEQRSDKRPMMSDLRDSGSIEQDADVIMLLYRDGYYNPGNKINKHTDLLEIHIAKNRQGETAHLETYYNLAKGRIYYVENENSRAVI